MPGIVHDLVGKGDAQYRGARDSEGDNVCSRRVQYFHPHASEGPKGTYLVGKGAAQYRNAPLPRLVHVLVGKGDFLLDMCHSIAGKDRARLDKSGL
jgi:hypothetical protein